MLTTYEPMSIPPDNPMTPEKVALGRQLFFDERLSVDGTKSCYSCHVCEHGLTDGLPKAIGAGNKTLTRSSPTLWNIGYHKEFYWDGRSASLEKQALAAWTGANMGAKAEEIVVKLNALQGYKAQFQKVFQSDATPDNVVKAIAAYERTIISGDTAWDRYKAGDQSAISQSAFRGSNIFIAIKCNNCHDGVLFTDQQYHNIGIGMDAKELDPGRFTLRILEPVEQSFSVSGVPSSRTFCLTTRIAMRRRSARLDMSIMHDSRSTSAANAVTQSQLQIVLRQTPIASATACWL